MKSIKLDKSSPETIIMNDWWKLIQQYGSFDNATATDKEWDEITQAFSMFAKRYPQQYQELANRLCIAWLDWLNYKDNIAKGKKYGDIKEIKIIREGE